MFGPMGALDPDSGTAIPIRMGPSVALSDPSNPPPQAESDIASAADRATTTNRCMRFSAGEDHFRERGGAHHVTLQLH
ncbi:hypothetical protein GCM10010492_56930 [Saccharothrix mutabilis subsp. mutabilis]|uniref:Uncharacterized protein n=1 Tax=Saccharothrix mutabilis subsp. mutabilis TaxID=66855 RepID=A0ABN0UG81_9PSEU